MEITPGIDPKTLNSKVRPQDDLFQYMNGTWIETTEIPSDQAIYGSFHILRDNAEEAVRDILEDAAANPRETNVAFAVETDAGEMTVVDVVDVDVEVAAGIAIKVAVRYMWTRTTMAPREVCGRWIQVEACRCDHARIASR